MSEERPEGPLQRIVRFRCDGCDSIWNESELLKAPSPFDQEDTLWGCPNCKSCDDFTSICDEPNCKKPATCGGPGDSGDYRRTCFDHATWLQTKPNAALNGGTTD